MTLKLKSAPAAPDTHDCERQEYLTTVGSGRLNPEEVLALSGTKAVVLVAVAIVPKITRTGFLEERGDWIQGFWAAALDAMPSLQGCRVSWDSMLFVAETTDLSAVQEQFRLILCSLREPNLQSRCSLSLAVGTAEEKWLLYDEMSHDLTAGGVGFHSRFRNGLIDGSDWTD